MSEKAPASLVGFLSLPGDPRGICLALAWFGVALLGAASLIAGDDIGLVYIGLALVGYVFLHARPLSVVLWAGVAAIGLWLAAAGNPLGIVQVLVGGGLVVVAARPPSLRPTALEAGPRGPDQPISEEGSLPESGALHLRSLGSLRVGRGDTDLTGQLNDRPLLAFIWLYLLVRAVRWPGTSLPRSALADELAPKLAAKEQGKKLKGQLWDLKHDLPEALSIRVQTDRHSVAFDLTGVDLDVLELRRLEKAVDEAGTVLRRELANHIQAMLDSTSDAEFLPGFDDLEEKITGGAGSAGQVVRDIRHEVEQLRANLALALADFESLSGRSDRAIAVLERALRQADGRPDVATRLVALCVRSGNVQRAAELRRTYQLATEG